MRISFDFDNTLQNPQLQDVAVRFNLEGNEVFIITSRWAKHDNSDLFKVAGDCLIPETNVIFTNGKSKLEKICQEGIHIHFEDCPFECEELNDATDVVQVVPFIVEQN